MSPDTSTPTTEARMVAIFRADLPLPPGKMAVQAGHAFLAAWRAAHALNPEAALHYALYGQTKVVLVATDLEALHAIHSKAIRRRVPSVLIEDAARTVLPKPTITVLGLGPMSKTDCNALTRGLEMA